VEKHSGTTHLDPVLSRVLVSPPVHAPRLTSAPALLVRDLAVVAHAPRTGATRPRHFGTP